MIRGTIPGEKRCEVCNCMFVNKEDAEAVRCKSCAGLGANVAGPNEQFIYRDVKRSDIEAKLNLILEKLVAMEKAQKSATKVAKEYSKKCDACGQVFVSEAPATKTCPECQAAKQADK